MGDEQIAAAQPIWVELFSHWVVWRSDLRKAMEALGLERFIGHFLPRGGGSAKGWTTSLVYGEPRSYGRLPHPQGRRQDEILELLPGDTQCQIFASIATITCVD